MPVCQAASQLFSQLFSQSVSQTVSDRGTSHAPCECENNTMKFASIVVLKLVLGACVAGPE